MSGVLELSGIRKGFAGRAILDDLAFSAAPAETVCIVGASGAGKSTLLNVLGLLSRPDAGSYLMDGQDVYGLSGRRRTALRGRTIGFVFQSFHLLPHLTAAENVSLPLAYAGVDLDRRDVLVGESLERVGLRHKASQLARTLSGGEQQRVAVARAMVLAPRVLLCDEPTGNLDSANSKMVIELLTSYAVGDRAVVFITHDEGVADYADRALALEEGQLVC